MNADLDILIPNYSRRQAGGFDFWAQLPPEHAGEDVLAQLRVPGGLG